MLVAERASCFYDASKQREDSQHENCDNLLERIGIVLVRLLWAQAILAAHSSVSLGLVALAIVWGLVIGVLGITRNRLLPGDAALGNQGITLTSWHWRTRDRQSAGSIDPADQEYRHYDSMIIRPRQIAMFRQ